MKVAVIGNGHVGIAIFRELQAFREIHELVLVGRNAAACQAEAEDYLDALPLRIDMPGMIWGGGFELAENADVLVYCAGPSLTKGMAEDRRVILDANIRVMKEVFDEVDKYAPNAMVVVVSNPLDVITTAIVKYTGRPASRVIGTGTLLDSARLVRIIAWLFHTPIRNVSGYVLGEHGGSSVALLSSIQIMNMHYMDYLNIVCKGIVPASGKEINADVRDAGFKIFRGKGYTSSGVAAAAARIIFDIANDQNEIIPVSTVLDGEYGVKGFAMSVPCVVGRDGIVSILEMKMADQERADLAVSAETIRKVVEEAGFLD